MSYTKGYKCTVSYKIPEMNDAKLITKEDTK